MINAATQQKARLDHGYVLPRSQRVGQRVMQNGLPGDRLIFIYNADGGIAQGILDSVHKTLSPATYACSLCAITYGAFTMDRRWRAWLKALPVATVFYHKDDTPYRDVALPVVLVERGGAVETLVSAVELNALGDVDALIAMIEARL